VEGDDVAVFHHRHHHRVSDIGRPPPPPHTTIDVLTERLTRLRNQLENTLEFSSTIHWQAQHTKAQSTITVLEEKVGRWFKPLPLLFVVVLRI